MLTWSLWSIATHGQSRGYYMIDSATRNIARFDHCYFEASPEDDVDEDNKHTMYNKNRTLSTMDESIG